MPDLTLSRPLVPLPLGRERPLPAELLEVGDYVTDATHPRGGYRVTGLVPVIPDRLRITTADRAWVLRHRDDLVRVRRPVACSCGYPGLTYDGPAEDCPTHGRTPYPAVSRG